MVVDVDQTHIVLQQVQCLHHGDTQDLRVCQSLDGDGRGGIRPEAGDRRSSAPHPEAVGDIPPVVVQKKAPQDTGEEKGDLAHRLPLPDQKRPLVQFPNLGQGHHLSPKGLVLDGQDLGKKGIGIHEFASRAQYKSSISRGHVRRNIV